MKSVFSGLYMAFGMFCTIPLPGYWHEKGAKHMMLWFPLVGAVIGVIWAVAAYYIHLLIWDYLRDTLVPLGSAVVMLIPVLLAGFIHLDGFMDTSDAILSRRPLEHKLRILKDPNTGAFAVIMVVILFILQYSAMFSIFYGDRALGLALLIVIPIVSRCFSALSMLCIRPMSGDGYAGLFKPDSPVPHRVVIVIVLACSFVLAWMMDGWSGIIVAAAVAVGYVLAMLCALKSFEFKGVSGDLAGFSLVISELCGLIALAIVAARV